MDEEEAFVVHTKILEEPEYGGKVVNPTFKCSKCHRTISIREIKQVCHRGRCKYFHLADNGQCQPTNKNFGIEFLFE